MLSKPIHKRYYHTFLSYATKDEAAFVGDLYRWLNEVADIPVWYAPDVLPSGSIVPDLLAEAIPQCRSMLVVLSASSVKSGWVKKEHSSASYHQTEFGDFKIIPVLIDDCDIPEFLKPYSYIDAREHGLTDIFFKQLLQALYSFDRPVDYRNTSDIFVSRTWRESEARFADEICQKFIASGFRLIGDSKDHPSYRDSKERVSNIIGSCGGLLSILPYREDKTESSYTSPYCLDEISQGLEHKLPVVVIAEPGVALPKDFGGPGVRLFQAEAGPSLSDTALLTAVENMQERWRKTKNEHYVFFATSFDNADLNQMVLQLIQQITGMPCVIGDRVPESGVSVQEAVARRIRRAFLTVVDISHDNINTLIEAGIARGANIEYQIVSQLPRSKPPFMFRDKQVNYYADGSELLGRIYRLVYPFRRRILNDEIENLS